MSLNGMVSIGSVIWTIIDVNWVMTLTGLVTYFAWNVLMMILIYRENMTNVMRHANISHSAPNAREVSLFKSKHKTL